MPSGAVLKETIRKDFEETRRSCHEILATLTEEGWNRKSRNPSWTNGQVLRHMLFGNAFLMTLVPILRLYGRLPRGVSRLQARFLDLWKGPFDWVAARRPPGGSGPFAPEELKRLCDRGHDRMLALLDRLPEEELSRGMHYPVKLAGVRKWDPNFEEFLTVGEAFRYMARHFHHHRGQLTL